MPFGAGKLFEKGLGAFKKGAKGLGGLKKRPARLDQGDPTYVYAGKRQNAVVYVGITNDIDRRRRGHGDRFRVVPLIVAPMPRQAARAIEEAMILRYGLENLENRRHEISPSHDWYTEAVEWADSYIDSMNIVP